jgi:hypothetical protein
MPFLHPQPNEVPWHGARYPLIMGLDTLEKRKIFPLQPSNWTTVPWSTSPQPSQYTVLSQVSNSCTNNSSYKYTLWTRNDTLFIQFHFGVTEFLQASMFYFENIRATYFLLTLNFRILQKKKKYIYMLTQTFSTTYIYTIIVDGCNTAVRNFQHSHRNLQTRLVKISQ